MAEGEGTGRTGDRLKQLRAFCHAARLESMSKAAERLDISQPAVSQHIRALEREFATPFFERRGPRITLTPAGAGLYRLAMPLVQGVERLPETFAEHVNGEAMGEVRVLAGLTASAFLLPDYLKRFRAVHEGVKVTLRTVSACSTTARWISRWAGWRPCPSGSTSTPSAPAATCSSPRAATR